MFPLRRLLPLLLCAVCAPAALAASVTLTCTGSDNQPTGPVLSFKFDVNVPVSMNGSGGSSGKPSYSLTAQMTPASYGTVYKIAVSGKRIPSCVLTRPNGSSTITITMNDVLLTDVQLLSGDYFLNNLASPRMQISFDFTSIAVQSAP